MSTDLAAWVHAQQCTRHQPCGYDSPPPCGSSYSHPRHQYRVRASEWSWRSGWCPGTGHREYYEDAVRKIYEKLEPEIGAANVDFAVVVITEELHKVTSLTRAGYCG